MNQTTETGELALQSLGTRIPVQLAEDVSYAMGRLKECVGGSLVEFVCDRLMWTKAELAASLSEEQLEAVALIIYNFEARRQAAIVGDQTGVGKGRVAAAVIRYGVLRGQKPIFVTDKANLFTDIYRDISDIGCGDLRPFIISSNSTKAHVRKMNDESGDAIFRPMPAEQQEAVFETGRIPDECDYVMTTYSQFSHKVVQKSVAKALAQKLAGRPVTVEEQSVDSIKQSYLKKIAKDNILILDESHSAAGNSNRGAFFREAEMCAANVCFLSATYSKRPENMPLYVPRTCVSEAGLGMKELDAAISQGGEAMQEVISSCIVRNGQMIRREYDNSGVVVNYFTLNAKGRAEAAARGCVEVEDLEDEHVRLADKMMALVERIVRLDRLIAQEYQDIAEKMGHTAEGDVSYTRGGYMLRVFNIVNQILFALKAKAIARHAVRRLKEGKAVVVAFSNTMEAALTELVANGVEVGDVVDDDFSFALKKDLESLLRYSEKVDGEVVETHAIGLEQLSPLVRQAYVDLENDIKELRTGLSLSPIDVIARTIEYAGFTTAEVTGRRLCLSIDNEGNSVLSNRARENVNTSFARFQNNKVDALLVNRSGATGASVHAIETETVDSQHVRQRLMVIAQMELDVNQEVQKRGRINRTGQTILPEYDYVSTAIPAEQRLMLMMQKKLLSLDANTSANMRQSVDIINVPDMMNRFGDMATEEYFSNRPDLQARLDVDANVKNDCTFRKVSGRIAILPVALQRDFYDAVQETYDDLVEIAKSEGRYDLDVEALPLKAKLLGRKTIEAPSPDGGSVFSDGIFLDTYECDNLNKPYTVAELKAVIRSLRGQDDAGDLSAEDYAKKTYRHILSLQQQYKKRQVEILWDGFYTKIAETLKLDALSDEQKDFYAKAVGNQLSYKEARLIERKAIPVVRSMANALERQEGMYEKYKRRMVFVREFWGGRPLILLSGADAVCLGVRMRPTSDDGLLHYRPSDVNILIALPDSKRSLKYNLADAGFNSISEINYKSYRSKYEDAPEALLDDWPLITRDYVADRRVRHIITGNLLKGYKLVKAYHGCLVKFSLAGGDDTLNGILLPDKMNVDEIPVAHTRFALDSGNAKLMRLMENVASSNSEFLLTEGIKVSFLTTKTLRMATFYPIAVTGTLKLGDVHSHAYARAHQSGEYAEGAALVLRNFDMAALCDMLDDCGLKVELSPEQAASLGLNADTDTLKDGWWPRLPLHAKRLLRPSQE